LIPLVPRADKPAPALDDADTDPAASNTRNRQNPRLSGVPAAVSG